LIHGSWHLKPQLPLSQSSLKALEVFIYMHLMLLVITAA
jgi:hypothetical protein